MSSNIPRNIQKVVVLGAGIQGDKYVKEYTRKRVFRQYRSSTLQMTKTRLWYRVLEPSLIIERVSLDMIL